MGILFIILPLFSLMLFSLLRRSSLTARVTLVWLVSLALMQIAAVIMVDPALWSGTVPLMRASLMMDNLSRVMLLSIGIVVLVTVLAAEYLIPEEERKFYFYNVLMVMLSGMNGIVLVSDIFTLYVFLEITSVGSFIIIALKKERDGLEGALKYIIFSSLATVLFISSIAFTLLLTGETSFSGIQKALLITPQSPLLMLAIALYLIALFIKSGLIPFHGWLPDAYSASTSSVSILLAGIVTKAVGIYPLIRIFYSIIGFNHPAGNILLLTGAISIVAGALAAIGQSDYKRMLAYSSISQIGYIVIGLGTGSALGLAGAIFHLFNHSIFKSLLFLNAAAVKKETGLRNLDEMGGLAAKMPITGTTSALAALALSGIPPLSGFWSKLLIIIALWKTDHYLYAVIAVMTSLITLSYMLILQRKVFFGKTAGKFEAVRESGFVLSLPAVLLAAVLIAVGLLFPLLLNSFLVPIGSFL